MWSVVSVPIICVYLRHLRSSDMMKMAPLARALAADFSIQPLAFSL
jgi:hypothetical protein